MADSIVYEHESIQPDSPNGVLWSYKLVRYNNQVISVSTSYDANPNGPNDINNIIIKNLDTQTEITSWKLKPEYWKLNTISLDVFMYSDSILFVGLIGKQNNPYQICLYDLDQGKFIKAFTIGSVRQIVPVGQKYFIIDPPNNNIQGNNPQANNQNKSKIFAWSDLEKLDSQVQHISTLDYRTRIYPIDWSSSSIGQLSASAYIRVPWESSQMELLDDNFNQIFSINVQELFPNYQPIKLTNNNFPTSKFIAANANCLLYLEYKPFNAMAKDSSKTGQANIYCWNFSLNAPVNFPNYQMQTSYILNFMPFRDSKNQVKYYLCDWYYPLVWSQVYVSE